MVTNVDGRTVGDETANDTHLLVEIRSLAQLILSTVGRRPPHDPVETGALPPLDICGQSMVARHGYGFVGSDGVPLRREVLDAGHCLSPATLA